MSLPSAVLLAVIVLESTNLGSAEHTSRILYPIFHFLFGMDLVRFAAWHAFLRKTGHFVGYFTLSVLLFRSLACDFSATQHAMVLAMGHSCVM